MTEKLSVVDIIALANAATQLAAYFYDMAQKHGATPEEIAADRARAMARFDAADAALDLFEPPEKGSGASDIEKAIANDQPIPGGLPADHPLHADRMPGGLPLRDPDA